MTKEGREGGWEAMGSQRKQVKIRKEEKGDFIEKGKTTSTRVLAGHKGTSLYRPWRQGPLMSQERRNENRAWAGFKGGV